MATSNREAAQLPYCIYKLPRTIIKVKIEECPGPYANPGHSHYKEVSMPNPKHQNACPRNMTPTWKGQSAGAIPEEGR